MVLCGQLLVIVPSASLYQLCLSAAHTDRAALESSLAAHLESVNALLDPHERLDCLVIVTQPWTVESGFITPTFKVRRNRIEDVYAAYYERWVVERRTVIWHEA